MTSKNRVWAVAACAALALAVTGCGGDDKKDDAKGGSNGGSSVESGANGVEKLEANEIAQKAKDAMVSAKSMTATVDGVSEGQKTTAKLAMDSEGNCQTDMTMGTMGGYSLVKIGNEAWVKPTGMMAQMMLESGAGKFKDKYVHGTTDHEKFKDIGEACDIKAIQKEATDSKDKKWTKGDATEVDGKKAIAIKGTDNDGEPMTLYIATEGKPYPLKAEQQGKEKATILYSGWDEKVTPQKPSATETVEITAVEAAK
ncbi:hypothetical protein [Streptomyces sp. SAJ15]|uniref:hypothetical protein n=1 Tax=Streptomyces sp. SAJ15 TaxID=2011095 RepID=UPI001184A3A3|nr:hypothetical protein [Streptomyces sp. SAJ15]